MDTVSKVCCRCNIEKPLTEFYPRKHTNSYVSECKDCMKERSRQTSNNNQDYLMPRASTELLAIQYLHANGIPTLPGKALHYSHVDAIAFGCIQIEVKYSRLSYHRGASKFVFNATPAQMKHSFRAHLVMLICDYGDDEGLTHHFFLPSNEVFYIDGRMKSGFTFTPGALEAKKHGNNRVVMTQPLMDEARDRLELIYLKLKEYIAEIKQGA